MNANKSCTATNTHWIPGKVGTLLEGRFVYYQDDSTQRRFKTLDTADNDTYSGIGLDPLHVTYRTLKNPQDNPGIDWTSNSNQSYPAQYNCTLIGGRLPLEYELGAIATDMAYYGGNFNLSVGYRSTDECNYDSTKTYNRNLSTNSETDSAKTDTNPVRCVKGAYY
jgi:hypothetical protein